MSKLHEQNYESKRMKIRSEAGFQKVGQIPLDSSDDALVIKYESILAWHAGQSLCARVTQIQAGYLTDACNMALACVQMCVYPSRRGDSKLLT